MIMMSWVVVCPVATCNARSRAVVKARLRAVMEFPMPVLNTGEITKITIAHYKGTTNLAASVLMLSTEKSGISVSRSAPGMRSCGTRVNRL